MHRPAALLAMALVIGAPSLALHAPAVRADQTSQALPGLFEQLQQADSAEEAARIESRIWLAWLEPPEEEAGLTMGWIEAAMRSGELARAAELCDTLVERFPDYAEGWNKRATVRYLQGDFDGSVLDIRRTLTLEPRHFGAISGLGLIFLKQGDTAAALEAFEAVLKISPASANAQRSVERVRAELEQREI